MKVLAKNRSALFNYTVLKEYEAGISLKGNEVKSIKAGEVNIKGSFIKFEKGIPFIQNLHVKSFKFSSYDLVDPKRMRAILLNKKEINRLIGELNEKGRTLIPLEVYQNKKLIKLKIALCQGKKNYDKRRSLKEKENRRELEKAKKNYIKN